MDTKRSMVAAIGFVLLFAIVLAPWIAAAPDAYPRGDKFNIGDTGLVTWLTAYVPHVLTTAPSHFYDAPVFYPARWQLARVEHLATTGVLFGPIYLLTGNAVLAANVAVLCSYPLAAFFLWALLVRMGVSSAAAVAGGLAFALGVIRAPGSLYLAKLPNWVLPMVALLITRVREVPTWRRALVLAGGLVVAALSSYYMAVMTGIAAGLWAIAELARPREHGGRAALLLAAAAALGLAVVTVVSLPYLRQPELAKRLQVSLASETPVKDAPFARVFGTIFVASGGTLLSSLKWLGLLALASRSPAGRASRRGLAISLLARSLVYGRTATVFGHVVTTPYAWLAAATGGFFRYPFLFCVLLGFGESLLIAGGLAFIGGFLPRVARSLPAIGAAMAILIVRAPLLSSYGFITSEGETHPIYDVVARRTRGREGPLLELPLAIRENCKRENCKFWESEMVGSTRHWLPLVGGVSGYPPAHKGALVRLVSRLPDPLALDDLVSMTGVRWLLLRPAEDWGKRVQRRNRILTMPAVRRVAQLDGWDLLVVRQRPSHRQWRQQIAAGAVPGRTVLGYPVDIDLAVTRAKVQVYKPIVPSVLPRTVVGVSLTVFNQGTTTWPVLVWEEAAPHVDVHVTATSSDGVSETLPTLPVLPRDVLPGEKVRLRTWFPAPSTPGRYSIAIGVALVNPSWMPLPGSDAKFDLDVLPDPGPPSDGKRRSEGPTSPDPIVEPSPPCSPRPDPAHFCGSPRAVFSSQ